MKRNSRLCWLVLTFTCVLGFDLGAAGAGARSRGHSDPEPIVRIDGGRVQGVAVPGGYVFRALPYYDGRARLSTWIYTIAHRVTIDFLRRRAGTRKNLMLIAEPEADRLVDTTFPSDALDPEALVVQGEHSQLVRDALADLPPKYRLPLVYAAIAGLDYVAIAEMLRLPVGTVKTHVFRGKQLLKLAVARRMKV